MNRIANRIKFFDQITPSQLEQYLQPYYTFDIFTKALSKLSKEHGELSRDQLADRGDDNNTLVNIYMNYDAKNDNVEELIDRANLKYFRKDDVYDPKTQDIKIDLDMHDTDWPIYKKYYVDPKEYAQRDDAGNPIKNSKGFYKMTPEDRMNYEIDSYESREKLKDILFREHSPYQTLCEDIQEMHDNGGSIESIISFMKKSPLWKSINIKLKEMYFPQGFPWPGKKNRVPVQVVDPDTQQVKTKYVLDETTTLDGTTRNNPIVAMWVDHKNEFEAALKNNTSQDVMELSMWLKKFMTYMDQYNTEYQKQVPEQNTIHMDEHRYKKLQRQLENYKKQLDEYSQNTDDGEKIKIAILEDIKEINDNLANTTHPVVKKDLKLERQYLEQLVKIADLYILIQKELDGDIAVDNSLSDKDRNHNYRLFNPVEFYYRICNDINDHIKQLQSDQIHDKNIVSEQDKINNPYNAHYMFLEMENIYRAEKRLPLTQIEYKKMASRLKNNIKVANKDFSYLYYGSYFMNKLLTQVNYVLLEDE